MRVLVAGGNGFVGGALCRRLSGEGREVLVLSRSAGNLQWDGRSLGPWTDGLKGTDAVVNLAGANIADGRWTAARKRELHDSRILSTRAIVEALSKAKGPKTLISASAVGYYGGRGDEVCDEASNPGDDFLAKLCVDWEEEAQKASAFGIRVVRLRIGVVLAADGGALAKMIPPFKMCAGGPLGSGAQWISWISREDLAGLVANLLESDISGPVNATAPKPVTNRDFSSALGRALGRPAVARVPAFVLRLALGEMAEVLLEGQKVLPKRALESNFVFKHPDIDSALRSCFDETNS